MFFSDGVSGKVIAWGNLPPGFSAYSAVVDTVQSYGRPYTAVTELTGSPTGRSLFFDSGECFHQIKFGQGERHSEGAYDDRTMMPVKTFRNPESYLDNLALMYSGGEPVRLFSKEDFPGFTQEPEMVAELNRSRDRLSGLCAPGIVIELQNVYAEAAIRTYRLQVGGQVMSLSLGAEITASEYCLRAAVGPLHAGRVVTPVDGLNLGVGMTVATIRTKSGMRFGSGKTVAAKAAYIDWEARKVFGYLCPGEPRRENAAVLRDWIATFRIDAELYKGMVNQVPVLSPDQWKEQYESWRGQAEKRIRNRVSIALSYTP